MILVALLPVILGCLLAPAGAQQPIKIPGRGSFKPLRIKGLPFKPIQPIKLGGGQIRPPPGTKVFTIGGGSSLSSGLIPTFTMPKLVGTFGAKVGTPAGSCADQLAAVQTCMDKRGTVAPIGYLSAAMRCLSGNEPAAAAPPVPSFMRPPAPPKKCDKAASYAAFQTCVSGVFQDSVAKPITACAGAEGVTTSKAALGLLVLNKAKQLKDAKMAAMRSNPPRPSCMGIQCIQKLSPAQQLVNKLCPGTVRDAVSFGCPNRLTMAKKEEACSQLITEQCVGQLAKDLQSQKAALCKCVNQFGPMARRTAKDGVFKCAADAGISLKDMPAVFRERVSGAGDAFAAMLCAEKVDEDKPMDDPFVFEGF